eukprot:symbB.v1.2.024507.t1/scaffold2326.1/size131277/11
MAFGDPISRCFGEGAFAPWCSQLCLFQRALGRHSWTMEVSQAFRAMNRQIRFCKSLSSNIPMNSQSNR